MLEYLQGKKTYIISATIILYALVVLGWGSGEWTQAGQLILEALGLGAVRNAIK